MVLEGSAPYARARFKGYAHMNICSYIKRTRVLRTHVCTKIFQISVALCGATCYYVVKQGRKGATYRIGNEVMKLSTLINDGSRVIEMLKSSFDTFLMINARDKEFIQLSLNVTNGSTIRLSCTSDSASEYIEFIDALRTELRNNDIAIVIENDYSYDSDETTILVVCND